MELYANALAISILEYLNRTGGIPRKQLYTPFTSYAYRYYTATVRRLQESGYVEVYRFNELNHIRITEDGRKALKEKMQDDETVHALEAKPKTAQQRRRLVLVSGVIGLCEANDIAVKEEDKPPLADLFGGCRLGTPMEGHPPSEGSEQKPQKGTQTQQGTQGNIKGTRNKESEAFFEELLADGVFYSSGEIRQAYTQLIGKSEIANWTRLVGVVFRRHTLSYIYSVNDSLIKWMPSSESRTVDFISHFFVQSKVINKNILLLKRPNCIICGKGMTMIPKIVFGRKWGRINEDDTKAQQALKAKVARDHINAHNIGKVFSTAYYVPVEKAGVEMFNFVTMLDTDTKEKLADNWFSSLKTAQRLKTLHFYQGMTRKHERVLYMPYIDLLELEYYKKQGEPCHVVCQTGTQESISRVLGPLVLSIRSLKGSRLKYGSYDKYGAPME